MKHVTQVWPLRKGDYVRSRNHGHTGRVYKFEYLTNEADWWVKVQSIQPTIEQIRGKWVGILCNKGGAVLVPIDTCEKIPAIKGFTHPCAKEHFP